MNKIIKMPLKQLGYGFIPEQFRVKEQDEYFFRDRQQLHAYNWRSLTAREIEILVKNQNTVDHWSDLYVSDEFNPHLVKNCRFHGRVRIGDLESCFLDFHDLRLPVGLYNSTIISCDIGSNVAIHNVSILSHYIVGDQVIMNNVHEAATTNYAKFGNGILKEGEDEEIRIWVEVANENGGRKILPFQGMLTADSWLWSKFRDDTPLMNALIDLTQKTSDSHRGFYGRIGDRSVVKECRILKDVEVGTDCYIKGANKLKNLTISSSEESPTQIGEGVELVNGIIGFGCHIFYGVKAVRFVICDHSNLKYGARLINSVLGENSTISCCEVLNSLIFPGHEQHHNSSFLCASTLKGQTNMASAATVGSNHNSRGNDGEIVAGRGFWPGLSVSLKHNSQFASFNLIVKGAYPSELNNPLPFSLISNDETTGELLIMPAYWFLYNMYALARNSWKYGARDKRKSKALKLEFEYLAPDTVNEMFTALTLLEEWAEASEDLGSQSPTSLLESLDAPLVYGQKIEHSRRSVKILKAGIGWRTYREMIHLYGIKILLNAGKEREVSPLDLLLSLSRTPNPRESYINTGGQLIPQKKLESLKDRIKSGSLNSWDAVHGEYTGLASEYDQDRLNHGVSSLLELHGLSREISSSSDSGIESLWNGWLDKAVATRETLNRRTYESRKKDYDNPFRMMTFNSDKERDAVLGALEENSFIHLEKKETENFKSLAENARI